VSRSALARFSYMIFFAKINTPLKQVKPFLTSSQVVLSQIGVEED